ncbi:MAG: polysaccharide biosynthesis/export family protein [Novosphingobium sp.]
MLLCLAALTLSACAATRGGSLPYGVQEFGQPDAPSDTALEADYRIAPLDKLAINIFQVDDLSGEYQVDLTGHIAMPLLGNVPAVDQTPAALQQQLQRRLTATYLKNPSVTVGVVEAGGSKVTVEGAVRYPGVFPLYGRTTLIQAIAMARGLNETANAKRVAIFRQIDGQRMGAAFDLTTIRAGEEADPPVYRGDIVVVDGSKAKQSFLDVVRSMPILSVFAPVAY